MAVDDPIPAWQAIPVTSRVLNPTPTRDVLDQERAAETAPPSPLLNDIPNPNPRFPWLEPVSDVLNSRPFGGDTSDPFDLLAQTDWMHNWAAYSLRRSGIGADPNFTLDVKRVQQDAEGLDETWTDELIDTESQEEYDFVLASARQNIAREQEIAKLGAAGIAGRLIMNVLDPSMLGLSLGGEAALPAAFAAKGTRLGRILRHGTAVGAINAGAEGAYMGLNPTIDLADVGTAFAIGLVFGGVAGGLKGSKLGADLATHGKKVVESNERLPVPINADGTPSPRTFKSADTGQPGDTYATYDPGNLGAAGNPDMRAPLDTGYKPIAGALNEGGLDALRIDSVGSKLRSTKSNWMRQGFPSLLDDGVGSRSSSDAHVSESSAYTRMDRLWNQSQSRWYELVQPSFKKWRTEGNSTGFAKKYTDKGIFMRDVADYVEWDDATRGQRSFHPEVMKVGGRYRDMMKNFLEQAKRLGVEGFENITPDKFYVPKYLDHNRFADVMNKVLPDKDQGSGGWEGLVKVVRNAILENHPDIDPKLLDRFARGYTDRIAKAVHHLDEGMGSHVVGDAAAIREKIFEFIPDIDEADAVALAKTLAGKRGPGGLDSHTMSRAGLNYDVKTKVWMKGTDGQAVQREVSVGDFFVKDAEFSMMKYARQMSGRLALADAKIRDANGNIVMDGIKGRKDFQRLKNNVSNDYATTPVPEGQHVNLEQMHRDLASLDFAWENVNGSFMGTSMGSGTRGKALLRRISWFNFIRLMNNMGFNQVQEFVGIYNQHGLKAMMKGIPQFGRLLNSMGELKKRDEIVAELQGWTGLGQDTIYAKSQFRYDHEKFGEGRSSSAGEKLDRIGVTLREGTVSLSGMKWLNSGLQQWAMKSAVVRFNELALKGFKSLDRNGALDTFFRGKDLQRLKSLGLRDEDIHGIIEQFNTKVTRTAKGDVEQMNLDQWDPNVRSKFTDAIFRVTNKAIQTNDPGNMAMWMQYDLAKFVLQFKSFIISAYTKQTLYGLRHMDFRQFTSWMMQLAAGMLTYQGMHQIKSLAFNSEEEAKADAEGTGGWQDTLIQGFARTPMASIVPTGIDNALFMGSGFDASAMLFARSRASGIAVGGIDSLPISSAAGGVFKTLSGAEEANLEDRGMTRAERLGWTKAAPFSNWLPFATLLNYMNNEAPSK